MRYKLFGRTGLRVSELCLGTATFGTDWGWGAEEAESRRVFDGYVEAGGNFLDTADVYQLGTSERLLGQFIKDDRARFVVATKYTVPTRSDVSFSGNSRKHMTQAIEASLKRLQTDYVDLYWVHMRDGITPVDEIMRGLDDLVRAGKVLYIGFSDFPAWTVAQATTMADLRGWAPLASIQIEYSLVERTPERELLPMAREFDLAVLAWSPLGGGILTGKYADGDVQGRKTQGGGPIRDQGAHERPIVAAVQRVATELHTTPSRVALAWVRQRPGVVIPILGARTLPQLQDNLGVLDLQLGEEHLRQLDTISAVPLGFPHELLQSERGRNTLAGGDASLIDNHRAR
ncbi:MAG: aldo/keto reductase [Roseiflexaceae bacterium]|nr:aldo/keto reductase [Roseiflexaceae bacterium]